MTRCVKHPTVIRTSRLSLQEGMCSKIMEKWTRRPLGYRYMQDET
jgi:hypothetical protein